MQRRHGAADERIPEYDGGHDGGSADGVKVPEGATFYYEGDFGECVDVYCGRDGRVCGYDGGGFLRGEVRRRKSVGKLKWPWKEAGVHRVFFDFFLARRGVGFVMLFRSVV